MPSHNRPTRASGRGPTANRKREDKAALLSRLLAKPVGAKAVVRGSKTDGAATSDEQSPANRQETGSGSHSEKVPQRPWAGIRAGAARLEYFGRIEPSQSLSLQPWAREIVDTFLRAAEDGNVHLCLLWPTRLDSVALLHAMASLERNCVTDLRGLRTVLYPGNNASKAALDGVLVERTRLSELFRSLWDTAGAATRLKCHTESASFVAMLDALNDIHTWYTDVPNPALSEIVPSFIYDEAEDVWRTSVNSPLERSLKKIARTSRRRALRQQLATEWRDPAKAPGALLVVHNRTRKHEWRAALSHPALRAVCAPELFVLDATSSAERKDFRAVAQIVDFLFCARDTLSASAGAVILTDDPKTFFVLRSQLRERQCAVTEHVWAGEAEHPLLSPQPVPDDWTPEQRSNAMVHVTVVDRDASSLALTFQRLAKAAGNEESAGFQAMMAACHYIVRLSNMPAGYSDLTAASAEGEFGDFASQRNAWSTVEVAIGAALAAGALNERRDSVERALGRARKLIDDWGDATPIAARLFAEVARHALRSKAGICLVLPSNDYARLAQRYLARKLGAQWCEVAPRIEWHTLASVRRGLSESQSQRSFVFVGMNREVLKLLLTHPRLPHGSALFVPYQHADAALKTLSGMRTLDAFKAYRGRIGLLIQELEARLKEVPDPVAIERLGRFSFKFELNGTSQSEHAAGQAAYRLELDGGGRTWATGWLYRYEPDEDPCFRRIAVQNLQPGDFIFEMSNELRTRVEQSLGLSEAGGSLRSPAHTMLTLYRDDVRRRCDALFPSASNRAALARAVHEKMISLNASLAGKCRIERIRYWLHADEGDSRPHGSREWSLFELFCRALGMSEESSRNYWELIHSARLFNQYQGRALAAQYAEILFQPESAIVYRRLPSEVVQALRQEAIRNVVRVERVIPPLDNASGSTEPAGA